MRLDGEAETADDLFGNQHMRSVGRLRIDRWYEQRHRSYLVGVSHRRERVVIVEIECKTGLDLFDSMTQQTAFR